MNKCLKCGAETENPKFCGRSCSASFTNSSHPRRKCKKLCIVCGFPVSSYRRNRCDEHWKEFVEGKYKNKTVGEYRSMQSVAGKHPSWRHSHIRALARSWLRDMTLSPCSKCGYNKHVELAHIREISSFPDDAKLSEINSRDNVLPLCPNCHWEFDNLPR